MERLQYRAGATALKRLRANGLSPQSLRALVLPAVGPRWLVTSGIDRALAEREWLRGSDVRTLLLGASVGAWRALALASPSPEAVLQRLLDAYCDQHFSRTDSPRVISAAYAALLAGVFSEADLRHALEHPHLDLGLIAVRSAHWPESRANATALLLGAALLNACSPRARRLVFERVLFTASPDPGASPALLRLSGRRVQLTLDNARAVALASGTVPLYMEPVREIAGAPQGCYLDGALTDYHLNQPMQDLDGIALFCTHDPRIVPSWLDKFLPWRRGAACPHDDLLVCHPSADFIKSLPGGEVPSRDDFERFVDRPAERFRRWRESAARSAELGEAFLLDAASGAIAERAQPL